MWVMIVDVDRNKDNPPDDERVMRGWITTIWLQVDILFVFTRCLHDYCILLDCIMLYYCDIH